MQPAGRSSRMAARHRARLMAAAVALLIIAACIAVDLRGSFEPVNLAWQSQLFRWRTDAGLDPPRAPMAIVAWDVHSEQVYGNWTRPITAQLIDRLHAAGARLIMLDRLYEDTRDGTTELAAAMRRAGNVVLAQEIALGSTAYTNSMSLVPLEPTIAAAARAIGIVNLPPPEDTDPNARYRRYNYDILALRDAQGRHPPSFALAAARALGLHPVSADPTFLIHFAGRAGATFPVYSLADVVDGSQQMAEIRGKIVLVGDEVSADKDYFATPVDSGDPQHSGGSDLMYGVELNAHALNTLIENDPLQRPSTPLQILFTFPPALLAAGWATRARIYSSLLLAVGLIVVLAAGAVAAFIAAGFWIDVAAPALAIILAPLGVLGVRHTTEERANREVRSLFGRYVSPSVVSRIVENPDHFGLDGELRQITVLFSDIRSFTTLSESMPPQRIVRLLSQYFTVMVAEIQRQGGTVDKYVGDAIMALFGAPDDLPDAPVRAVRAALAMQQRLASLNEQFAREFGVRIATGIGLHHGPAAVGVMGAPAKREYSAIGDTVNAASRLEGVTKDAGYAIVASATVVQALPADLLATCAPHDLGKIAVKGKITAIRVYGLGPPRARMDATVAAVTV